MDGSDTIYTTNSVIGEIKDKASLDYLESQFFRISVRDPRDEYVKQTARATDGTLLYLSGVDVSVVALTLELHEELCNEWIGAENINVDRTVKCISRDNGIRNVLNSLGLLNDAMYSERMFKLRCYACTKLYDYHVDFCKACGYNTITRVTVINEDGNEKVLLKKDYVPRKKVLKSSGGVEIRSADQKEYIQLLKQRERSMRLNNKLNDLL